MSLNQEMQMGIEALQNNKIQEAEKIFKSLSNHHPSDHEVIHLLGITYQLLNKIDEAIVYYKKAIDIKPNFAEAHKNLGNMFYKLGKINEAEPCYKKSIQLDPKLEEAKINLEIVLEQKKVLEWISKNKNLKKNTQRKTLKNPFITKRKVELNLLDQLYKIQTLDLEETKDIRFGNGKCSSDLKLFEKKNKIIESVSVDIINIIKKIIGSEIYIAESFFNILKTGSGTKPHKHLAPFDKQTGIDKQKYSLTYYVSVGDQTGKEPGILKLYDPHEDILPSDGTLVIIPSGRTHSSFYDGKKDRVMIGVNFYSLY